MLKQVRAARMTAMKERNTVSKSILTTLLGELESIEKRLPAGIQLTDAQVIQTCKKFIESNTEVMKVGNIIQITALAAENVVLETFIPKQLTEEELYAIIVALMPSKLGDIMQHLKNNYQGLYNGKLASNVANKIIG